MMSIDDRPTMRWKPSGPIVAESPVTNQPSSVIDSAVVSGRLR